MVAVRHDFKAVVRAVNARTGGEVVRDIVLPPSRKRGSFTEEAYRVWESITRMSAFVQGQSLPGTGAMSATERGEVESVGSEFLTVCAKRLDALTAIARAGDQPGGEQTLTVNGRAHRRAVVETLRGKLEQVGSQVKSFQLLTAEEKANARGRDLDVVGLPDDTAELAGCVLAQPELSAADEEQLAVENAELHAELSSMVDDARLVEAKLAQISAMSHTIASKLSEQGNMIDEVQKLTESASSDLLGGNRSLESAEKHARDYRLYQLLFFLASALLLLVCDWWYS